MQDSDSNSQAGSVTEGRAGVAAIVLAAGGATRMGRAKALLSWQGVPLVRHIVGEANASGCAGTWVVCGEHGDEIAAALDGTEHELVAHPDWREGLGSSIATGVRALPAEIDAALLLLCDQPFVTAPLLDSLIGLHIEGRTMAACRYGGSIGPPALFAKRYFESLSGLRGDRGAKPLLVEAADECALVDFPDGAFDLDTPDDYDRALAHLAESASRPT